MVSDELKKYFGNLLKPMRVPEVPIRMQAASPARLDPAPSDAALRDADIQATLHAGQTSQAFSALVERYEAKVFRLCMSMLQDSALAQDIAQEVFLRVWRFLSHYDARIGAFSTWIFAITRNQCLSAFSRPHAFEASLGESEVWQQAEQIPMPTVANDAASLALLRRLVDALPSTYRTTLTLYYFEECSVAEVANLLGVPEGTVKTHLHRARSMLRQTLKQHGLADFALWS
jgi:RNA polymerase sigma-70 factor (ECF subfamily)